MEEKLEPFIRHGTEEERIEVSADEILNAIAEGRDVDVEYAVINNDLRIEKIDDRLTKGEHGRRLLAERIRISNSEIHGSVSFALRGGPILPTGRSVKFCEYVSFNDTMFRGDTDFFGATFEQNVGFSSTKFCGGADFSFTVFSGEPDFAQAVFYKDADFEMARFLGWTDFIDAVFHGDITFTAVIFDSERGGAPTRFTGVSFCKSNVDFNGVAMEHPADFADIKFLENTVIKGLWNLTIGRHKRSRLPVTDFSRFNTNTVMDSSSNPYLKRYIDDEQWIASWRQRGWWRKVLFVFWELTSHCGRSFGLWLFWAFLAAVLFGAVYADYIVPSWLPQPLKNLLVRMDPKVEVSPTSRMPTRFTPYYFSIVTFTTLGFGDVKPLNLAGEIWLALEVIIGYIMLGGLISIFANKFARRS